MTQVYYVQPGETLSASHLAALQAAGVTVAVAAPPSGTLGAGMVWAPAPPASIAGVLTQQWTQVEAPALSPPEVCQALLNEGCSVESTSTPALNGVYSLTPEALADLTALVTGVAASAGLPAGATSVLVLDAAGAPHSFTAPQLVALGAALRNVVYQCKMVLAGQGSTAPIMPVVIA